LPECGVTTADTSACVLTAPHHEDHEQADPARSSCAGFRRSVLKAGQDPELRGTALALRALARRVKALTAEERELQKEIEKLTRKLAPQLLEQIGVTQSRPPRS
jgi:hypothetical protein